MSRKKYTVPHGEGSFYRRGSDGRWVGVIDAGWTERGTRRRIQVSSRDKDAAWDKLVSARKRIALDGAAAVVAQSPTVKAWAEQWLSMIREHDAPQGWAQRQSRVRRWIVPQLGHRRLDALTPGMVRELHTAMAGSSQATIRNVHSTLMTMLRAAVVEGHTVPESVRAMRPPAADGSDRDAIPLGDAVRLVQHIATTSDAARWVAALLQGMRQGECLGLTWDAIDWDRDTIDVSWQVVDVPYEDRAAKTHRLPPGREFVRLHGTRFLSRPKSTAGRRRVPMVPWMREALRAWQAVAPVSRLVWPQERHPERPRARDADRAEWRALCDAAQVWRSPGVPGGDGWEVEPVRYTLHEARHTCASLLLLAGVDVEVVREIMGHSSVEMSRAYQHADLSLARQALARVAGLLELPTVTKS